jgi:hypothetical protein
MFPPPSPLTLFLSLSLSLLLLLLPPSTPLSYHTQTINTVIHSKDTKLYAPNGLLYQPILGVRGRTSIIPGNITHYPTGAAAVILADGKVVVVTGQVYDGGAGDGDGDEEGRAGSVHAVDSVRSLHFELPPRRPVTITNTPIRSQCLNECGHGRSSSRSSSLHRAQQGMVSICPGGSSHINLHLIRTTLLACLTDALLSASPTADVDVLLLTTLHDHMLKYSHPSITRNSYSSRSSDGDGIVLPISSSVILVAYNSTLIQYDITKAQIYTTRAAVSGCTKFPDRFNVEEMKYKSVGEVVEELKSYVKDGFEKLEGWKDDKKIVYECSVVGGR